MKDCCLKLLLPCVLIAALSLTRLGRATAETLTTLHEFAAGVGSYPYVTNNGGAYPVGRLVLSGSTLYGIASAGGDWGNGTVFRINTNGTGFTTLHTFSSFDQTTFFTNIDGAGPHGDLTLNNNLLYGTAAAGGSSGNGILFALNTEGTYFTNLYSFTALSGTVGNTNANGAVPLAGLVAVGADLYGAASAGGQWGGGTVFRVNSGGTDLTNLHSFSGYSYITNTDGGQPSARMILSGNILYGTTREGGPLPFPGSGTVFAVKTDGADFEVIHTFAPLSPNAVTWTNSDGADSYSGLIQSGNTLYGTASVGGTSGSGTVFALNTDGTDFRVLHSFAPLSGPNPGINSDGAGPGGLVLLGDKLYGTSGGGGSFGSGTVFAVRTNGTGFAVVYTFSPLSAPYSGTNSDGAYPASLILSDNILYGVTSGGGSSGNGTLFRISLSLLQLAISQAGTNVILTWPTNTTGFVLQAAPTITGTFTNVLGASNPYTNAITGKQRYFRLISN